MALNSTDNAQGFEPRIACTTELVIAAILQCAAVSIVLIGLSSYAKLVEALVNRYGPIKQ